jgi:Sec-independent protein translocase protein TatA
LGKSLGKSLAEFKKASNELRNTLEEEIRIEEQKTEAAKQAPPVASPPPTTSPHEDSVDEHHQSHSA